MMTCRGNALFLILIAVALFAALSYAVTNSGRGGGSVDRERAQILASQIVQYSGLIQAEVQRIRISGYDASEIDFGSDVFSRYSATPPQPWVDNPNCDSDDFRVFQSNGGTVPDQVFNEATFIWGTTFSSNRPYPGHPFVSRADIAGIGTTNDDLIWGVPSLHKEVCDAINTKIGLDDPQTYVIEDMTAWGELGTYNPNTGENYWSFDATAVNQLGDQDTRFEGVPMGCFRASSHGYTFYSVLIPR